MDLEDLRALAAQTEAENHRHSQRIAALFRALYEFPKTTIAAVQGPATAAGAGLATLCDFTLASPEASFGYTEVRIGFIPAIVAAFLRRQVAEKHARELLLTGRIIGAHEAYRIGLVNELVEEGELHQRAHRLAEELLENSPASLRATKAVLRRFEGEALSRDLGSRDGGQRSVAADGGFQGRRGELSGEAQGAVERVTQQVSKFQGFKGSKSGRGVCSILKS